MPNLVWVFPVLKIDAIVRFYQYQLVIQSAFGVTRTGV